MSNAQFWLLAAGLVLNLLVLAITGTSKLNKAARDISAEIIAQRKEIDERIDRLRLEIDSRREVDLRAWGETMLAIRSKIGEMELWNRDNFARRDSVHALAGRLETRIEALDEKMSEAFEKLSSKIDERTRAG
jgi:Sec-independent protein translocase protein TatA